MKKTLLILLFLFLAVAPVYAEQPTAVAETSDTVSVGQVSDGDGEALVAKTNQMANDLHQMASKIIIPITIMVLIVGGLLGIFLPLFRKLIIFAILGLVLILWAPILVTLIVDWVSF